jgi:hypothetical protein
VAMVPYSSKSTALDASALPARRVNGAEP